MQICAYSGMPFVQQKPKSVMRIGLVSDTHGVYDQVICSLRTASPRLPPASTKTSALLVQALETLLNGVQQILHAGDVGHKGSHPDGINNSCRAVTAMIAFALSCAALLLVAVRWQFVSPDIASLQKLYAS